MNSINYGLVARECVLEMEGGGGGNIIFSCVSFQLSRSCPKHFKADGACYIHIIGKILRKANMVVDRKRLMDVFDPTN
jgi:hypothetical protein